MEQPPTGQMMRMSIAGQRFVPKNFGNSNLGFYGMSNMCNIENNRGVNIDYKGQTNAIEHH